MPILTYDELDAELSKGKLAGVYLLYGPEEYLLRRALSTLKEKAVSADSLAFDYAECSGKEGDGLRIIEEASTFPMMSARRLVLVVDAEQLNAAGQERIAAYAAKPMDKSVLCLVAGDIDRRTSFFKRMTERAQVIEFPKLKGMALERWIAGYIARRGYSIAVSALKQLADLAGSDLMTLCNEIEKLLLYAGREKEIRESAVNELVFASRQRGIFELTAALGKRDRKAALWLLANMLQRGEPPLVVVGMLARHFRQILIAKELLAAGQQAPEIGRAAQVPEFALRDFLGQVRAIETESAQKMYRRLAWIDRSFKSANPDERMVLEHLICSL